MRKIALLTWGRVKRFIRNVRISLSNYALTQTRNSKVHICSPAVFKSHAFIKILHYKLAYFSCVFSVIVLLTELCHNCNEIQKGKMQQHAAHTCF